VVHDQDGGLDVHDVVLLGVEEQPVVEQGKFGVASCNLKKDCVRVRLGNASSASGLRQSENGIIHPSVLDG
jgi:hypothetical protein